MWHYVESDSNDEVERYGQENEADMIDVALAEAWNILASSSCSRWPHIHCECLALPWLLSQIQNWPPDFAACSRTRAASSSSGLLKWRAGLAVRFVIDTSTMHNSQLPIPGNPGNPGKFRYFTCNIGRRATQNNQENYDAFFKVKLELCASETQYTTNVCRKETFMDSLDHLRTVIAGVEESRRKPRKPRKKRS
jgi:hypothetical protein